MIKRNGLLKGFMTPVSMGFLLLLSLILTGHLWSISLSKSRLRKNQNFVFLHNKINQSLPEVLSKIELQERTIPEGGFSISKNDWSLNYHLRSWGLFDQLRIVARLHGVSAEEKLIIGKRVGLKSAYNFFFKDHGFPLFLSGDASIKGRGSYPKKGIRTSTLNHQKNSTAELDIGENWIPRISYEKAEAIIRSSLSSIIEGFEEAPLLSEVIRKDVLELDEFSKSQDQIFLCNKALIKPGYKGRVQVFARSNIEVAEGAILDYPSALILIDQKGSIRLQEGSTLSGSMVSMGRDSFMKIEKGSNVIGEVFSFGTLDLKGRVEGFLMANQTIHNSPSGKRRSLIVDGVVKPFENLPFQVFSSINPFIKSYGIASY